MKEASLATSKEQEEFLRDHAQGLKKEAQCHEDQLRDANQAPQLQFKEGTTQTGEHSTLPSLKTTDFPVLIAGQDDTKSLTQMFGQLNPEQRKSLESKKELSDNEALTNPLGFPKPVIQQPRSHDSHHDQPPQSHRSCDIIKRPLIPTPSVVSQFDLDYEYNHIVCTATDLAWVETAKKQLQLVDRAGMIKETVKTDFIFYDTALTSDGEFLFPDSTNNCIKLMSRQKEIITLFKTNWSPCKLCCLHNNDIVVTFGNVKKVIVYSRIGNIRQTLDSIKFGYPQSVAVNKVNHNIYICDIENIYRSCNGKVIAAGANGQLRYEYTGQEKGQFSPMNLCSDLIGHVLITDFTSHRVHILDRDGQFIQYILTLDFGPYGPVNIDVDTVGYVWVSERIDKNKGRIKVAKYLE